ncbi:MAG: MlaD family protein [Gemmatimonadota bacterium]|nr:MlaD family protein [Gemmatimonadota bacterium]MDH5195701.1 MlaD family protein [Gemmatimonadota bacterium]
MRKGPSPLAVGGFVVGAVTIAIALIVVLGSGRIFAERYPFVAYFSQSVAGLQPGAPVKFKGVTIGSVRLVTLSLGVQGVPLEETRIPVVFEIDRRILVRQGVDLDLADPQVAEQWVGDGMRVVLAMESIVTGRKYIGLEVMPNEPVVLVGDTVSGYIELPTVRTGIEGLDQEIQNAVRRFAQLDVDSALSTFTSTMQSVQKLVETELDRTANRLPATLAQVDSTLRAIRMLAVTLDSGVAPLRGDLTEALRSAAAASTELRTTLVGLQAAAGPDSPLFVRLEEALTRLASASYAVETLMEYLARNPSAPLRGKPQPEKN